MQDLVTALSLVGAYSLGILTVLGVIWYIINKYDQKTAKDDEMAMAQAVGVVKDAMPGSTILSYEQKN